MKNIEMYIQMALSMSAIIISVVALIQTRISNGIQRQMQELAQWVDFRVEFTPPSGATNIFEKEMLVRDIKIFNDGFRMKKLYSVSITTILQVVVVDSSSESEKIVAVPCLSEDYYTDSKYTYQTKGLLYSAKSAPLQQGVQIRLKQYVDKHPDRFCRILPSDWVKVDYVDIQGVRHQQWLVNSSMVSEEEYNVVMGRVREFKRILEDNNAISLEQILDCCYKHGAEVSKNYCKVKFD